MESVSEKFVRRFRMLCDKEPFPWQIKAFEDLMRGPEYWPKVITAPTGAGKTNFMAAWLLALVAEGEAGRGVQIPRRLIWVVNRRVVVDQATTLAAAFAARCKAESELRAILLGLAGLPLDSSEDPLAVSTLRGEKADNREWRRDIARAAIVVGTVDMIGSRLLFRGYGDGSASRPQHAALLGHDALIVNDEAHLTPAFAELLQSVKAMQGKGGIKAFHAIRLTATLRDGERYPLDFEADFASSVAFRKRYEAVKRLELVECADRKEMRKKMLDLAAAEGSKRTIVFLTKPGEVRELARDLAKRLPGAHIAVITGTQRGYERDALIADPKLQAFFSEAAPEERHWLIATSAAEVGIDVTSDRMISCLDTADHLLQRFGRLNRFGEEAEAIAQVVYVEPKEKEAELLKSLQFLKVEPDISPRAIFFRKDIPFPPSPRTAPLEDWVVDRWSMTSLMEGMPKIANYLHGLNEGEEPRTELAWREEVSFLSSSSIADADLEKALRVHRVLAREKVDVRRSEAIQYLEHLRSLERLPGAEGSRIRAEEIPVIVDPAQGKARAWSLGALLDLREQERDEILAYATLLLEADYCFLDQGMLSENSKLEVGAKDVADVTASVEATERGRYLIRSEEGLYQLKRLGVAEESSEMSEEWRSALESKGWRIIHEVEECVGEDPDDIEYLVYVKRLSAGRGRPPKQVSLMEHIRNVQDNAQRFASALRLEAFASSILKAAEIHDDGKNCDLFQNALGAQAGSPLAKSGRRGKLKLGGFRHELASMVRHQGEEEVVLHLVAAHHGEGRPRFEACAVGNEHIEASQGMLGSQPNRYSRLQRQFGPWGLAYLEAVVRSADWLASEEEQAGHE